jgi:peptidoglycan/xylan/chitin deacetylase (PgdA/CDA1 family)
MGPYLHLLVIVGLAAPILVYLGIMQTLGWRAPVMGMRGALGYVSSASGTVLLYASPQTRSYLQGIGGNYEVLLTPWRNYLSQRDWTFKEIQDTSVLKKYSNGVLILPSALALGKEERADIMAFHAAGGAILTTWATGTRAGSGDWEGWEFLRDLGTTAHGEIAPSAEANHLILTGESPLSRTLSAGQRVFMSKTAEPILRLKGEASAARLMNWARVTDSDRRAEGAVVYTDASPTVGRVVSFAFAESTWESHPLPIFPLFDDTIAWLQREPAVTLAAWPQGKQAAQVIEMDTEQGFANATAFAAQARAAQFPASFYILTSVAKQFPDVLRALAREFDIGYHGDIHVSFKGQPLSEQGKRLQDMRAELTSILPKAPALTGFRAPTEGYDATTELLLQKNGFRHHVADPNRTDGRLPLIAKQDGVPLDQALIVLPRTQRDDLNLHWEKLTPEQTVQALIDDADQAFETGSLGLLSIHSQNFGPDSALTRALPDLLAHLKTLGRPLWMASASDVAQWWRERERVRLSSNFTGKRLEISLTITGDKPVKGAALTVMLPHKGPLPVISSTKIGGVLPAVLKIDDYRAALVFDSLAPGNYFYQATFE